MDLEKLIDLVHGHKCLWDQSDTNYKYRDHQSRRWHEISKEMEVPVDELKKKWRGLRDTFRRELRKATKKKNRATGTEPHSKWSYFKHLLFLRGTMSEREIKGNIPEYEDTVSDADIGSEGEDSASSGSDCPNSSSLAWPSRGQRASLNHEISRKAKRRRTDEIDAKLEDNANDHDTHFLMSLLPFLRDVPKHRKLLVRSKLQQVLIDEQIEEHAITAVHLNQPEPNFDTLSYKIE